MATELGFTHIVVLVAVHRLIAEEGSGGRTTKREVPSEMRDIAPGTEFDGSAPFVDDLLKLGYLVQPDAGRSDITVT